MYKNIKMNNPLSGSLANVCTEFKIPERTKKVPSILNANVVIHSTRVQDINNDLISKTIIAYEFTFL